MGSKNPGAGVFDYSGSLSAQQKDSLNSQCSQLRFRATVVVLPKDKNLENPTVFGQALAKQWRCDDNTLLIVIDLKNHGVFSWSGGSLSRVGLTEHCVSNQLIPTYFAPAFKSVGLEPAIQSTLYAANNVVYQGRTASSRPRASYQTTSPNSGSSSYSEKSETDSITGFIFFFLFCVIVAILFFKRKGGKPQIKKTSGEERLKFKELMERLEVLARTKPRQYFARVAALAIFGYAYIWAGLTVICILSLLTLLLVAKMPFLAIKLGLPLIAAIGLVLKSFWLRIPPVEGIELKRKNYPIIYAMVENIRHAIKAPRVDTILVVPDINAAVTQRPRLGILGWQKNYLLIGMPLVQSLSYEQFESVLAHELGHLAGGHYAGTAWIYNVRAVWAQLLDTLFKNQSIGVLIFSRFFNWYAPYFDAYSFSLARQQEKHADKCAIKISGAETTAIALLAIGIKARYMQNRYWKTLLETVKESPTPPKDAHTRFTESVATGINIGVARTWLSDDLAEKTNFRDTHPAKRDRVSAILDIEPEEVPSWAESHIDEILAVKEPAANTLFGKQLPDLLAQLDAEWVSTVNPFWEENHKNVIAWRVELEKLEEKAKTAALNSEEQVTLAIRTAQVKNFAEAEPIFKSALAEEPDNAALLHSYGVWLLDDNNPEGVDLLKRAMEIETAFAFDCCQEIYAYLKSKGRDEEADLYADRLQDYVGVQLESHNERSNVDAHDTYLNHDLGEETLREIRALLKLQKNVDRAILVKKKVIHHQDNPVYVLVVDFKHGITGDTSKDNQYLADLAQIGTYPVHILLVTRMIAPPNLRKFIKDTKQESIF